MKRYRKGKGRTGFAGIWKRLFAGLLTALCLSLLLCVPCCATDSSAAQENAKQNYAEQFQKSGASALPDKLPEDTRRQLSGMGVDTDDFQSIGSLTPKNFFSAVFGMAGMEGKGPLKAAGMCLGVILLCALVNSMKLTFGNRPLSGVAGIVAALCICIGVIEPIVEVLVRATAIIKTACGFTLAAVPVTAAILAALGRPASAASMQIMLTTAGNLVEVLSACVFAPGMKVYLAMSIASSVSPDVNLSGLCRFFSKAVKWLLGLSMTLFTGLLSVRGLISAGADTLSSRTARFVISSVVPVVGNALSDALHTVTGCVQMLRSGVGGFVLLAMLILFLPIVLSCLLWMLTLSACAAVGEVFSLKEVTALLHSCSTVLEILLAVLLCCMTVLIVSCVVLLMMGGGAA
ncbi:MAG: stage III sporulation protein AE [Oscillospiraceae bacterium]|jgi:stage III sporulation protein AE|nr:stage III sporulation protein AE [Oscillospiraceae bacterium]